MLLALLLVIVIVTCVVRLFVEIATRFTGEKGGFRVGMWVDGKKIVLSLNHHHWCSISPFVIIGGILTQDG